MIDPDLAVELLRTGRHQDALAALDEALERYVDVAELWVNRGIALHQLGQSERARGSFDEAITLDPDLVPAWRCRAIVRLSLGDRAGAIRDYLRVTELTPDDPAAWRELAGALREHHHGDEIDPPRLRQSVDAYDRAIALDPGSVFAWGGKAMALELLAQHAQVIVQLGLDAGDLREVHGELVAHLDAALARFPDDPDLREMRRDAADLAL